MKIIMKKGFTLIEMLIVVAIIAILASALWIQLGGTRRDARDARRVADLSQVQQALEIYYLRNRGYPNVAYSGLAPLLQDVGAKTLPDDPLTGRDYRYRYFIPSGSDAPQNYVLETELEIPDSIVLNNDIDADPFIGMAGTAGGDVVNCTDNPTGPSYYCVSF